MLILTLILYTVKVSDVIAIDVVSQLPEEVTNILSNKGATELPKDFVNKSRRILNGREVTEGYPFMVHLKLPTELPKSQSFRNWLCGGVIIHEEYVLTSAACIEDAEHFYVVSGTFKWAAEDDRHNNPCIKNGAKKAIWKCIPKNYIFDGHENDNLRWMNNDIAVVKIEEGFDFSRRIRGCEFIPRPICYNNQSLALENPGSLAFIAGWGTTLRYNDWIGRRFDQTNQPVLLEAEVEIISKSRCKRRWGNKFINIIDNYMICTKNNGQTMSEICNEKYVDCQDINYSGHEDDFDFRRSFKVPKNMEMHSARNHSFSRRTTNTDGGFCENDHGGPLIYGQGVQSVVIGVISACLVKERTNKCYGPYLYTSVYKNRQFISCAIYKDVEPKCRRHFRSGVTHDEVHISWANHPDGPAKSELQPPTTTVTEAAVNITEPATTDTPPPDFQPVNSNGGFVKRALDDIPQNKSKNETNNATNH